MGLDYVVITSVDRDDLSDQGSGHFAETVQKLKKVKPNMLIEALGMYRCFLTLWGLAVLTINNSKFKHKHLQLQGLDLVIGVAVIFVIGLHSRKG